MVVLYAQYAVTILRTFYNFCWAFKGGNGNVLNPAQRIGITDKQFQYNDIMYFSYYYDITHLLYNYDIINSLCNQIKDAKLCSISGKPEFVKYFAEQYSRMLGISYKVSLGMESYQGLKVIKPQNVQGKLIRAELKHIDIVSDFWAGFGFWCFGVTVTKESQIPSAEEMIKSGNLFLWEVDKKICSMVNIAHRSKRYARINNVYTPPEERKKGYASAIVAELSSTLCDEELIPMLYADIKNANSNNVYKGIGFKESGKIDNIVFKYQ